MTVYDFPQLSPEWWDVRRGVPTASEFHRIMTPKKMEYSAAAAKYIYQLISDRVSLNPPVFTENGRTANPAMQNGRDEEPHARRWYALERGYAVRQVGFCLTDDNRFGCSPDGLVETADNPGLDADGGLELKCPLLKTHAEYLARGELPLQYHCQVHGSLIVTGRKWWDFLSYAPGLPPFLVRVYPDGFTDHLRYCLERFWLEYEGTIAKLAAIPSHRPTNGTGDE